jgi:hypothetical protein
MGIGVDVASVGWTLQGIGGHCGCGVGGRCKGVGGRGVAWLVGVALWSVGGRCGAWRRVGDR